MSITNSINFNSLSKAELDNKQSALSTDQLSACNSGITASKVSTYDGYASSKANDNAVIHNSGNETITGTKTFSGQVNCSNLYINGYKCSID